VTGGKLDGRCAVITGASRGLGEAIALALGKAGARLALVARNEEKLGEVSAAAKAFGADTDVFPADVASEKEVRELEAAVRHRFGKVDILINNAGINIRKPLEEFTLEEWKRVMDTNVTAAFLMCRSFVPHMKGRGYGRILNLTSTMSHVSLAQRTAYSASKAALLGMTRALALELAGEGITVVGISPGPFATEMNTALRQDPEVSQMFLSRIPLARWGNAEEVGQLAVYLCSEEAGFITGTDILIDGGWCAQ
jgi:NAD(P)-dependent dehydrogenase (short-subunit alcohol dehydrogenase family)